MTNEELTERVVKLEKQVKALKKPPPVIVIPPVLDTPEFREAWYEWVEDKKERGKHLTSRAVIRQMRQLARAGMPEAVAMLDNAMASGWTAPFPLAQKEQKALDMAKHTANVQQTKDDAKDNPLAQKIGATYTDNTLGEWGQINKRWNELTPAEVRKVKTAFEKETGLPYGTAIGAVKKWWWKKRQAAMAAGEAEKGESCKN